MADNKDKDDVKIFYDISSWLQSVFGQNALAHDNLNIVRDLGFGKEADSGRAEHNLKLALQQLEAWASRYDLHPVIKTLPGNKGSRVIFRPYGSNAKDIQDADCPFIEISQTGQDGNFVLRDGMLSANSPILVRGTNGEVGLASAMSVALGQVLNDWQANDAVIRNRFKISQAEGLKYLKRETSKSFTSVKEYTSGVFSNQQMKDYKELDEKSINNLRPEALWSMMSHVLTGYYQRSLYNANKTKSGAPTIQEFSRDIEEIMNAARGFQNVKQVSNYVKQRYSWIYKNVWHGDFENVFNSFAGKMSQSGMTEGTIGKFGLMEVEAALSPISNVGKKLKQNAQVLTQKNTFIQGKARAATGKTAVMSKNQLAMIQKGIAGGYMSDNDLYKDVYTTAFLRKEDLEKGRKKLKELYSGRKDAQVAKEIKETYGLSVEQFEKQYKASEEMWLKGFGADASFMGEDLEREFRDILDPKPLKDGVISFDLANAYVREGILREKQAELEKTKKRAEKSKADGKKIEGYEKKIEKLNKEIEKFSNEDLDVLERKKGKYVYGKEGVWDRFQKYVRKEYNLDSSYTFNNNYKGGKGEFLSNLIGTRARYNSTSVFRAGLTADERTVKSLALNLQMASSMIAAGYSPDEIFRDATNRLGSGGGLKAQNFVETSAISNKNIRSRIMQVLTYVNSELRDTKNMAPAQVAEIFEKDPFFKKFFASSGKDAIFSIDKKTGMLLVDNRALSARLEEKRAEDNELATDMLFAAVNVGKIAGVYNPNKTYFSRREVDGKSYIVEESPLLVKEELAESSPSEWMGTGKEGKARAKIGPNEMSSLEATLGSFSNYLIENGYTGEEYDKAIAPLLNLTNAVRDKLSDRKEEFRKYVDNAGFLEQTFSKDKEQAEQLQKDLRNNKAIVKLTKEDLAQMDVELDYSKLDNNGGMIVEGGDLESSNLVGPYLRRKREEYFKTIQDIKENKKMWESLSPSVRQQYEAIKSVEDLQTFALDLGDETLSANLDGQDYFTKMFALPLGYYNDGDKDNKKVYKPDEGLKYATRMLKNAKEFLLPEDKKAFNREQAASRAIRNMQAELQGYQKEITSGNTGEKYRQVVMGEGSGYMLLQGMTDASEEVLKDLIGNGQNITGLDNISRIVSTKSLKSMLEAEFSENKENVIDLYKSLFGKGVGKKGKNKIIQAIVDSVDISKKDKDGKRAWKGKFLSNTWSHRHPTINFINDLLGGGLVASSNDNLVAPGRMLINKYYAAIGKGDMDGDLMELFDAWNAGDFQRAGEAVNSYFKHEREYQRKIQEEEEKAEKETLENIKTHIKKNDPGYDTSNIRAAGEIGKANEVIKQDEKAVTVAAAWLGKHGAGPYGNAKFTAEDIIRETVGATGRQGKNITALGARVFGAIFHSLYQKGINIKNLKRDENGKLALDEEAAKVYDQMLSTMNLATSKGTWDDPRIMRAFVNQAIDLGVFKKDAMFEGTILDAIELNKITSKDTELLSQLKKVAENAKKSLVDQFGKDSEQVKQIEKDIQEIEDVQQGKQETLQNLSDEMTYAILGKYTGSFMYEAGKHGESVGTKMGQIWERIPGYASSRGNMIPRLGGVYGVYGKSGNKYVPEIERINKGKLVGYTSPTSEIKKMVGSVKENIQTDNKIEKLAQRYLAAESDAERAKIMQEAHSYTASFLDAPGAVDKIRGLISHKTTELLGLDGKIDISNWTRGDEGYNFLKTDKEGAEFLANLETQLRFLNPDRYENKTELKDFVQRAANKGVSNTRILRSMMGPNGSLLGQEMRLAGYSGVDEKGNYKLSSQYTDAMWTEEDENGLVTLHIADLKNPKVAGTPSLEYLLQLKDYERSALLLQDQLKQLSHIKTVDEFWAVKNDYTKNWERVLETAAANDAGAESGVDFELALQKRKAEFEKLFKAALQGFNRTVGHIVSSGDNGYTNVSKVNLHDEKLKEEYKKYLESKKGIDDFVPYNSDEANIVANSAVTLMGTYSNRTAIEAAQSHSKELDELKKRYLELAVAHRALNKLKMEQSVLARDISSPEKQVKVDKLKADIEAQEAELAKQKQSFDEEVKRLGGVTAYSDQGLRLTTLAPDGKTNLGVGDLLVQEMNSFMTAIDEGTEEANKQVIKQESFEGLVRHSESYKKQAQRVAELEAALKSPLLKGKNKSVLRKQTREQLKRGKADLEDLGASISFERSQVDFDENGNLINPYTGEIVDEELYGTDIDFDKFNRAERKKARQARAIADRHHIASYEAAVLDRKQKEYQFEDELTKLEAQRNMANEEGDSKRVEVLDLEIERLKEIRDLTLEMSKYDLDRMTGANKKSLTKMEEYAKAKHDQDKAHSFDSLTGLSDAYERQSQKVAELEAAMGSPLLKGENKTAIKKKTASQLKKEKETLAKIKKEIALAAIGLETDNNGNLINPYTKEIVGEDIYGLGLSTDDLDKENLEKAKQERGIADRRHIASYEAAVLDYEKQKYSFQDQISEKQTERYKAEEEGDNDKVKRLELELERLEKIRDLTLDMSKMDLNNMKGANPGSKEKMEELAKLLHESDIAKKKQGGGAGGNGNGRGFLGIDSATSRWLSRIINGGAFYAFIRMVRTGLRDIINKAKQLDQAMTNLRIVTGKSASDTRTLISNYADLGKELGATTVEVTTAATAWLRQGYDVSQVSDLVTASLYLSKLGMIDTAAATQNLTSAMHGFKLEASEAMGVVDKLTALDVKAATTAGDIAQGLSQFANIASLNGVSIDQAAAYVATIADVNQMSGTSVGQSLKTIMSRYGNVKAGAYNKLNLDSESSDTSEKLNDVERVLTKMGISIRKTNLEFKDFDEVLDEIADKWGTLDNVSKKAIANALAGIRQQESVLILLENYDKYKDLLKVSENSEGTAEKKYQSYKESYAAAKNEFTAALEQFTNSSEVSKLLRDLTKVGTKIVEFLQKFGKFIPGILGSVMRLRIGQGNGLFNQVYNLLKGKNGTAGGGASSLGFSSLFKNIFHRKGDNKADVAEEAAQAKEEQKAEEAAVQEERKNEKKLSRRKRKQLEIAEKNRRVEEAKQAIEDEKARKAAEEEAAKQKKAGRTQAALAYAELLGNIITTSYTALKTSATTHEYNGETVESSEEAQKQGGAWSAALVNIPLIGGIIGPLVGEAVAASIDADRDAANAMTAGANRRLAKLQGLDSSLSAIGASERGSSERHKLVQEFRKEIFDKDNVELRQQLTRHLGGKNLATLLEQIDSNTAESTDALKTIQIAQIHAQRTEIYGKHASELYEGQTEINKTLADMDNAGAGDAGGTAGIIAASTGGGAAAGALAGAGIGSVVPVLGTAIGAVVGTIVGVVGGLISGILAGSAYYDATEEAAKQDYTRVGTWAAMNSDEKIDSVKEKIQGIQDELAGFDSNFAKRREELVELGAKYGEDEAETRQSISLLERAALSNETVNVNDSVANREDVLALTKYYEDYKYNAKLQNELQQYNKLLELLEKQTSVELQILEEMNELTLQEALVAAKLTDERTGTSSYLTEMTMSQLKNAGIDKILTTYGKEVEAAGGLNGVNIWADKENGVLSEIGYDYLFEKIRKQGDEEINAVLSGEAYSLQEALNLRQVYGDESIQVQKLLHAFSNSLGISVDALDEVVDKFGKLTLAETMMSTEDIMSKVDGYANLMSAVASGTGEMSSWMQTILNQFPELTAYMGDTSKLFAESIDRIHEFEEVFLNAQYQAIMSSEALFTTVQTELFEAIGDNAKEELLKNPSLSKLSDIMTWVQGQYGADGKLSEEAVKVVEEVKNIADKYGMTVTSSVLKNYYDQLIAFSTKTIDVELENLESQKSALNDIVHQREYENKLIEAKLKLEEAGKQKKRVYRAGVGWVYESDQAAVESAQKELDALDVEKRISQLDARSIYLQGQKQELNNIYENENYETLEKLYNEAAKRGDVVGTMSGTISSIETSVNGITEPLSEYLEKQLKEDKEKKDSAISEAQKAWEALNSTAPGSGDYNAALENFHSKMSAAVNAGAVEADFEKFGNYANGSSSLSRIHGTPSAWEVSRQDINTQKTKTKTEFNVVNPEDTSKRFMGISNGDLPSTQVAEYLIEGLKANRALIWTDAYNGFKMSDDYRFAWSDSDTDLYSYFDRVSKNTGYKKILVSDPSGQNETLFYENGQIFKVVNDVANSNTPNGMVQVQNDGSFENKFDVGVAKAWGSLGLNRDSLALVNEFGTEAIVTPQGTLTALPSRTGIIPADITKNLWELGGVAPSLVNMLERMSSGGVFGKSIFDGVGADESFNIANLVMNITADSSFDVDKFVSMIKTRATLTKNNTR